MNSFENPERKYSVTGEEKKNLSPKELAEFGKKIDHANALSEEGEREKAIGETEEGIKNALYKEKE